MTRRFGFGKSRQVAREDTPAFGAVAERVRRGGDASRAVELCREGLKTFPDQLSARVTLGWALLDLSLFDEAREELERVLERAPDNLAAIRGLAQLHEQSEGAEALRPEQAGEGSVSPNEFDDAGSGAVEPVADPAPDDSGPAGGGIEVTLESEETPDLVAALDELVERADDESGKLGKAVDMVGLLDEVTAAGGDHSAEPADSQGPESPVAESPIVALERFLDRARTQREKVAESVV